MRISADYHHHFELFKFELGRYVNVVNRLRPLLAALLVILWMPLTSLCLVQACGVVQKGDCCPDERSTPVSNPHECDQACGLIASGNINHHTQSVNVQPPSADLFFILTAVIQPPPAVFGDVEFPSSAPPTLGGSWLFSFRVALPARAPSLS